MGPAQQNVGKLVCLCKVCETGVCVRGAYMFVWSIRVFPVQWDCALGAVRCSHRVQLQCPFHTTVREAFLLLPLLLLFLLLCAFVTVFC